MGLRFLRHLLVAMGLTLLPISLSAQTATPTPTQDCCVPVLTYSAPTSPLNLWNGEGEAGAITVDDSGNLYAASLADDTIVKILPAGSAAYTITCIADPTGLAIGPGPNRKPYLFACAYNSHRVYRIDPDTGYADKIVYNMNQMPGQINNPNAVSVDEGGNLYISARGNQSVQVFAYDSGNDVYLPVTYVNGTEAAGGLQFSLPLGTLPLRDRLYVVDSVNSRVLSYPRLAGNPLAFGVPSVAVSQSGQRPRWIATDGAGRFYLSGMSWDYRQFSSAWAQERSCGSGWTPRAFAYHRNASGEGRLYVGRPSTQVAVFNACDAAPTFTPQATCTPTATRTATAGPAVTPKPNLPDLDVIYVERLPRYRRWWGIPVAPNFEQFMQPAEGNLGWPLDSDAITYKAHVVNKGAAGQTIDSFGYRWTVDGVPQSGTHSSPLAPGAEAVFDLPAGTWASSPQTIFFEADPSDLLTEICEANNRREARKWDLTVRMMADTGMAAAFNRKLNTVGSYSYEDWVHLQYDTMNAYWKDSTYGPTQTPGPTWPVAPGGMIPHLRVDKIVVSDEAYVLDPCMQAASDDADERYFDATWYTTDGMDPTNECGYEGTGPEHPCASAFFRGGYYEWFAEVYTNPSAQTTPAAPQPFSPVDWGVPHETSHQLGMPDLYTVEINSNFYVRDLNNTLIPYTDPRIPDIWPNAGIMGGGDITPHTGGHHWESWNVAGFNTHFENGNHFRSGFNCEWMWDTPPQVVLRVVDLAGTPVPAVGVTIYQRGVTQQDSIDNTPEHRGVTDANGLLPLMNTPIAPVPFPTTLTGHSLKPNPFGQASLGTNGLFFIRFTQCSRDEFDWLSLVDVNQAYWMNKRNFPGQEDSIPVTFTYRVSLCQDTPTRTGTPTRTVTSTSTPRSFTPTSTSTPTVTHTGSPTNTPTFAGVVYDVRINAGGADHTDTQGKTWVADRAYTAGSFGYAQGGSVVTGSCDLVGVPPADYPLWRPIRYGTPVEYRFDVPTGDVYEVTLLFSECFHAPTGNRTFYILLEGVYQETLALVTEGVHSDGTRYPVTRTFYVTVTDGTLNILLGSVTDNPLVAAIQVRGSGSFPTFTPTHTPTISPTLPVTDSPTDTVSPTFSPTDSATATPTASPTASRTSSPTVTLTLSLTDTWTPTNSMTPTPSSTSSSTRSPTASLTATPSTTATCTDTPTKTSSTTATPSSTDTWTPSYTGTSTWTYTATQVPSDTPTFSPTPTHTPSSTSTVSTSPTPSATLTAGLPDTWTPTSTPVASLTPHSSFLIPNSDLVLFPNPCTDGWVDLWIRRDSSADLIVVKAYTVASRRMAEWTLNDLPVGECTRRLELLDKAGKPLANGLYYLALSTPEGRRILHLLVLR